MRILVLSKRQYTGRDLLDDRYGRLYEIPATLATCGHQVIGLSLSYRQRADGWQRQDDLPGLAWFSVNALPGGLWNYPWRLAEIAAHFRPDIVWACSDAFHAIIGAMLCRYARIPLVIDLYDNFESYAATRLPGVITLFRAACRHASGLTIVSQALRDYVVPIYRIKAPVTIIANGIRCDLFHPQNREIARASLGLPIGVRLIGTAGSISSDRDITSLFDAFMELAVTDSTLYLVYAGPRDGTPYRYRHPRIIDLGILPFERVPEFYSALDVAVICNCNSAFGRYCFPQKLYEIVACHTPLVAAGVGDVRKLLIDYPKNIYEPHDSKDLAEKIREQLDKPRLVDRNPLTWAELGGHLEEFFQLVINYSVK